MVALGAGGCSGLSQGIAMPPYDAEQAAEAAIKEYDKNGSGQLEKSEWSACPPLELVASSIDTDRSNSLSREEIAARVKGYMDSNTAVQSLSCKVTANGRPLAGATVRFVPVEFLGAAAAAAATTRADGIGAVVMEDNGVPGLAPGMYRVEVSLTASGAERVHEEYNQNSRLGYEMMPTSDPVPAEFRVKLK